ncbi:MAG: hypothetical protein QXS27_03280, partial [Candidatus Jordarchaeaceae archaeon]
PKKSIMNASGQRAKSKHNANPKMVKQSTNPAPVLLPSPIIIPKNIPHTANKTLSFGAAHLVKFVIDKKIESSHVPIMFKWKTIYKCVSFGLNRLSTSYERNSK